jgi:hypothetical protein
MAATLTRGTHAQTRTSDATRADVAMQWRMRCQTLEESLQDATAALRVSELERRELSLDYRHCLHRLWALNARLPRTGKR